VFAAVAVNVTLVPKQIGDAVPVAKVTEGVEVALTAIFTVLDAAAFVVMQLPPLMLMLQEIGCVLPAESVAVVYVLEEPL
jgi:hypothetical protein